MARRTHILMLGAALLLGACGDINARDGVLAGASYCQEFGGAYHFKAHTPPWKYNKEYKCTNVQDRQCLGSWIPTGRYVFVVSDIPFVNYDSEIVTMMNVELTSGSPAALANALIQSESIGAVSSKSEFYGDEDYPAAVEFPESGLSGVEVLWRQNREFEGTSYNWYRRDVFLKGSGSRVFHLELYSIGTLDKPEFDAMIGTFSEGPAPDGAPDCQCRDEHDPSGVVLDC